MFSKKIAVAVLLAASAYAQGTSTPTSSGPLPTSSLTPCIITCAQSSTLCTFTDASCVCVNTDYQQAVLQCLQSTCTPEEVQTATSIQAALCNGVSSSSASLPTSSISSRLSSVLSSVSSRVSSASSRVSSASSRLSSATNSPTGTGSTGGAKAGYTASFLAAGGAVVLGVIGGGMLVL